MKLKKKQYLLYQIKFKNFIKKNKINRLTIYEAILDVNNREAYTMIAEIAEGDNYSEPIKANTYSILMYVYNADEYPVNFLLKYSSGQLKH